MLSSRLNKDETVSIFHKMLDAFQVALIMVDEAGDIVYANRHVQTLFGYYQQDVIDKNIAMFIPQAFREAHPEQVSSYFANSKVRPIGVGRDVDALRIDGSTFPAEIFLAPVRTRSGHFVVAAVSDITERKEIADELEREQEKERTLQAVNQRLTQFAHTVSHDLSDPLAKIQKFFGRIEGKLEALGMDDETREDVGLVNASLDIGSKLIADLLSYSRAESPKSVTVDLNEVVADIIKIYPSEVKFVIGDLPSVIGDPVLTRQIFANLVSNAVKFHHPKTEKRVEVGFKESDAVFFVKDNGIGIARENLDGIFQPFNRVDKQHEFLGTGLGLTMCQRAIVNQGGKIWVKSEPEKGTTFYFTLKTK